MEIRRLEVYCRVVELRSFTRAAEASLLSQPSVSENVRMLEEEVGEKLLDRLGREVLPTPAGELLYHHARKILQSRDEALQALAGFRGRLAGVLAAGGSTIPGTFLLPSMIESFKQGHPEVRLILRIGGTARMAGELLQGELELAVLGALGRDQRLVGEEIFTDELVLALPAGHPWSGRRSVKAEELKGLPFILREEGSGTRTVMERALQDRGVRLNDLEVVAEMGSTEAVRQGIKSGIGASILSALAVTEDWQRQSLITLPLEGPRITRPFFLTRRRSRALSPLAEAFREHLLRCGARPGAPGSRGSTLPGPTA